jgi:hypothetical protein
MVERRTTSREKNEMDKELTEIRARMEELALRVQQNAKTHWVYEWPLRRKEKWPVKKLLARRQQRLLRRWLRYVKSLRATEEMVHACEPEAGRNLSDDERGEIEQRSHRLPSGQRWNFKLPGGQ